MGLTVDAFLLSKVVHSESQENGQEAKRGKYEEEDELQAEEGRTRANDEKQDPSLPAAMETQSPSETSHDVETNTGNKSVSSRLYFTCCICTLNVIFNKHLAYMNLAV